MEWITEGYTPCLSLVNSVVWYAFQTQIKYPKFKFNWRQIISYPWQDKQELLRQWVLKGENLQAVETQLQVSRSQEGELTRGRELLTIREMKERNFSQHIGQNIYMTHIPYQQNQILHQFFILDGSPIKFPQISKSPYQLFTLDSLPL